MTRLTSVGGSFAARVLQAHLEDEGLTVELRGAVDSYERIVRTLLKS